MSEPLLLPPYAQSLQEQRREAITLVLCAGDQISHAFQEIGSAIGEAVRSMMDAFAKWFKPIAESFRRAFRAIEPLLPHYRRPKRRSSRRLAVQMKRARLGLDIYGRPKRAERTKVPSLATATPSCYTSPALQCGR